MRPKYIVNEEGKRLAVILSIEDYDRLLEAVEELGLIRAYDEAMASEDETLPFEQVMEEIERKRGNPTPP